MEVALDMEVVRYSLERFGAYAVFSPVVLESLLLESIPGVVTDELAVRLMGVVAVWKEERVLKVPADWWQAVKQRWFPKWALERWPVKMKVYDAAVILPKVPVVRPEYHEIEFAVWRERR